MPKKNTPNHGDCLKLVESLALKRHDEYGEEIHQGDFFLFLRLSAVKGYCECYCPRLKGRFWIKLEYLLPVNNADLISLLEHGIPEPFKPSSSQTCNPVFNQKIKEN